MAVLITTNMGTMTVELDAEKAPKTVANFLDYVAKGHYTNTIFHRVIPNFMIQGGGFEPGMKQKPADQQVENEGKNGLKNDHGEPSARRAPFEKPGLRTAASASPRLPRYCVRPTAVAAPAVVLRSSNTMPMFFAPASRHMSITSATWS